MFSHQKCIPFFCNGQMFHRPQHEQGSDTRKLDPKGMAYHRQGKHLKRNQQKLFNDELFGPQLFHKLMLT